MKNIVRLFVAIGLAAVCASPAFAVKPQVSNQYGYDDNTSAAAVKTSNPHIAPMSKAITRTTIDTAQNIRSILGPAGRSIACTPGSTADTVQVAYLRGYNATYALWHAYSLNGGANWTLDNVDPVGTRPRYPTLVVGENVGSFLRPAHIVYSTQASLGLYHATDSLGLGSGWKITLIEDTIGVLIPYLARRGISMAVSASDFNGGNAFTYLTNDGGSSWFSGQPSAFGAQGEVLDYINDSTIIAFAPYFTIAGCKACYWISYDSGLTFSSRGPVMPTPDSLLPQFRGSILWYDYDAIVVNGVPYVTWAQNDGSAYGGRGISGQAIFVAWPKDANDLAQGWNIRHVSDMWDTSTAAGFFPAEPSLGGDAQGRIYLSYVPYGAAPMTTPAAIVASADSGKTWTAPLYLMGGGVANLDPFEISRNVGDYIYGIGCDSVSGSSRYPLSCYKIPVADIWAQPVVTETERYVPPTQLLTPGTRIDSVGMDTVKIDTCKFTWQPGFAFGGTYELTASQTADWSVGASCYDLSWHPDSNAVAIIGMPAKGDWYWKVRSIRPDLSKTAWSGIYKFNYQGAAVNTTQWTNPSGVASQPVAPVYSFAVRAAYPNPAKNLATISFQLPKAGAVSVKVYNIAGQAVKTQEGRGNAGLNNVTLNTRDLATGVYFYHLSSGGRQATGKVTILR